MCGMPGRGPRRRVALAPSLLLVALPLSAGWAATLPAAGPAQRCPAPLAVSTAGSSSSLAQQQQEVADALEALLPNFSDTASTVRQDDVDESSGPMVGRWGEEGTAAHFGIYNLCFGGSA